MAPPKKMKSSRFKGIQSKSDQVIMLKANTELKNKNYSNEFLGDDGKLSEEPGKLTNTKRPPAIQKIKSESKKVAIDVQEAVKSPSLTRKFLKQRTSEASQKSVHTAKFSISTIK